MGNVRPNFIKRIAEEMIKENKDVFTGDFEKNKKILNELDVLDSKGLRNRIAGQIVRDVLNKKYQN